MTEDHSTNAFWLSVFTVGEAWHNNHHAFPFSARLGLKWWQIDIGWIVLSSMRLVGLVEDLKLPSAAAMASKRINVGKMSEQTHFA